MEIEYSKSESKRITRGSNQVKMETENLEPKLKFGKRKSNQNTALLQEDIFRTPVKKLRLSNSKNNSYHLSNPEKAYVFLHSLMGTEAHQIASSVDRDPRTIQAFLKDSDSPDVFVPKHKKKGRWSRNSGKINERHKHYLTKWVNNGSITSARDAYFRLNSIKKLVPVSYHPVRLFLKSVGDFVKPQLKSQISEVNREKRLKYCLGHKNFNFRRVLFTDESIFQLNSNNQKVFKLKGKKAPEKAKLNPNYKIMVWGGISYSGKTSLFIVTGKLKGDGYIKLLKQRRREMKALFAKRKIWYFQQDGAPCHRPMKVKKYIKNWLTKKILPHPPQSPDLNPIELIWAQMKTLVEKKKPRSKAQLSQAIIDSWDQISIETIRKCIDNIYKKIDRIIELDGNLL